MRQFIAVVALYCLLANIGCADIENEKPGQIPTKEIETPLPPETPEPPAEEVEEDPIPEPSLPEEPKGISSEELQGLLVTQIEPTTEAEKYMIYFSWPELQEGKKVRIRKEQILSIVPSGQTSFSHEVNHNQVITYTIEVLDAESKVESHFSKIVHVPRDFVVTSGLSEFSVSQKLVVNRLFINQNVPLRTNGHEIEITTKFLISENGIIETFPENQKADWSNDGRNGGSLTLKAEIASGDLKVFMRGEHGGDGKNGEAFSSRAKDGLPPGAGKERCECVGHCRIISSIPSIEPLQSSPLDRDVCKCTRYGPNGVSADNGENGRPGGRAGHGGNTGNLKVEISDGSAFFLQTFVAIGVAGVPGTGGPGQEGGIAPKPALTCSGTPGTDGTTGTVGPNGESGNNGEQNLRCIYIATESKNDCF